MEPPVYDFDYSGYGPGPDDGSGEEKSPLWISVFQLVFCSFGLVGNLVVIFVILALKEYKKTVTNWYVLQLAIADLMFLCTIPVKIKEKHDEKWPGSEAWCKLNESLIFLNYNSSILFLTVMSIDRYLIVCHNSSAFSQTLRKRSAAYIATVIVWAVSLIFCTPIFMYSTVTNCRCRYEFASQKTPEEECIAMEMSNDMERCLAMLESLAQIPMNCDDNTSPPPPPPFGFGNKDSVQQNSSDVNPAENGTFGYIPYDYHMGGSESAIHPDFKSSDNMNDSFISSRVSSGNGSLRGDGDEMSGMPTEPEPSYHCTYENEPNAWFGFIYFNFIVLFLLPFVIMLICYSLIVKRMLQSGTRKTSLTSVTSNANERSKSDKRKVSKSEKAYRKATRLCVAYVVLFVICWLPFHSVHLAMISGINGTSHFCLSLSAMVFILVTLNSAINPCLYSIVGKKFSARLRIAFSSLRGKIASQVDSFSSSSGLAVRYRRGKRHGSRSHSNSATATTKIYKGRSDVESSDHSSGDGLRSSGSG